MRPAGYYKQREPPDTATDKGLGDTADSPENQVWSFWVHTLLVPNDYSLLEEQTDVSQGDSVFQYVLKDDPAKLDDQIDPDGAGGDLYLDDTTDVNHKPDHQSEEMIAGRPENGNGGIVALPPGAGGLKDYPSVWTPGTGTVWNRYPPSGSASGDATDWQPAEGERQLLKQKLDSVTRDPTDPTAVGTADRPFGPNGLNRLGQYIDPRTVNRVVSIELTHPPNSGSTDPRFPPLPTPPDEQVYSPPTVHPFAHKIPDDTSEYNDLVDELVVCTTDGAYLMRSKTDANGVTTYDPPVLISDVSATGENTDVRDVTTADFNQDGVRDIVVVTGPGTPDSAYLADPTDPLMKKVGENSDDGGATTRGGLRKEDFGRTFANGGGDVGTPDEGPNDDVYTTDLLRDSTSVVAIDPDGDGSPDLIIVGTRKASDYMVCCGDAGTTRDIADPSGGSTFADTESIAAAMLRPPADPDNRITTKQAGPDGAADTDDDLLVESSVITVVFGTGPGPSETRGSVDYYIQIDAYEADGTTKRSRVTAFSDLAASEKRMTQLPGSVSAGDNVDANAPVYPRSTHTVKFAQMKRSASTGNVLHTQTENHLYLGYHHQDMNIGSNNGKDNDFSAATDNMDMRNVLGHHYKPRTDAPDTLDALESNGIKSRGALLKLKTNNPQAGVAIKEVLSDAMKDGMRGLDVLLIEDPDESTIQKPLVYLSSNGGTVYELIPVRNGDGEGVIYDSRKESDVKLGVMRADGTTLDLTTQATATEDDLRDAEYTAGLVVGADIFGDDNPGLSGRHVSYNAAAAGTRARTTTASAASTTPSRSSGGPSARRLRRRGARRRRRRRPRPRRHRPRARRRRHAPPRRRRGHAPDAPPAAAQRRLRKLRTRRTPRRP